MKVWFLIGLSALISLGGCDGVGGKNGLIIPAFAPQKIRVSGGQVVITGPEGFCIDPKQTKNSPSGAFVMLGSCAAISHLDFKSKPEIPAILLATVSTKSNKGAVAPSMKGLAAFLKTYEGRSALSRDGDGVTVEVVEIIGQAGVLYVHVFDYSSRTLSNAGPEYWRALFDVKGRVISASVIGLLDRPISSEAGLQMLHRFVLQIKAANGIQTASAPAP